MSYNDVKYKKNFLDTIIFRIDFSEILLLKDKIEANFQEAIKSIFPKLSTSFLSAYTSSISPNSLNVGHENILVYEFSNVSEGLSLKISYKNLIFEAKRYSDFEAFSEKLQKVLVEFNKYYTEYEIDRIGLRFINVIKVSSKSPLEWSGYINKNLIDSLSFAKEVDSDNCYLNRCMCQQSYRFQDDNFLTFNYGIYNSEWPAKITQNEFILDYDAYTKYVNIHDDIQSKYLNSFHGIIQDMFEKSIEEDLRKYMENEQ